MAVKRFFVGITFVICALAFTSCVSSMTHSMLGGEEPNPQAKWEIVQNYDVVCDVPGSTSSFSVIPDKEMIKPLKIARPPKDQVYRYSFDALGSSGSKEALLEFTVFHSGERKGSVLLFAYYREPSANIFSSVDDDYCFPMIKEKYSFEINNGEHFEIQTDNGIPVSVLVKKEWKKELIPHMAKEDENKTMYVRIPAQAEFHFLVDESSKK